jgi:hypothetical protein
MSCRLTGLPPDWLASLPALRDLNLRSNLLLEVDGREFRNAPRLFRMDLSYNPIGKLPVSKIGGKKQLLKLSLLPLLPPGLRRGGLPEHQFASATRLKYLDVSNCSLDALPMNIFNNNDKLQELRKGKNIICHFPQQ